MLKSKAITRSVHIVKKYLKTDLSIGVWIAQQWYSKENAC